MPAANNQPTTGAGAVSSGAFGIPGRARKAGGQQAAVESLLGAGWRHVRGRGGGWSLAPEPRAGRRVGIQFTSPLAGHSLAGSPAPPPVQAMCLRPLSPGLATPTVPGRSCCRGSAAASSSPPPPWPATCSLIHCSFFPSPGKFHPVLTDLPSYLLIYLAVSVGMLMEML